MNERDDPDDHDERRSWDTSPLIDHPVGPDDAGNAVMQGLALIVGGWRWVTGKLARRR